MKNSSKPMSISAAKITTKPSFNLFNDDVKNEQIIRKFLPSLGISDFYRVTLELARAYLLKENVDPTRTAELVVARSKQALRDEVEALGEEQVEPDLFIPSKGHNFNRIITESQKLVLVFNDMFGWIGNHEHKNRLHDRMLKDERQTDIYLIHPESPVIDYVTAKSNKREIMPGTSINRQVHDIQRGLCRLLSGVLPELEGKTKTRIFGHQWVHSYAMVMNERAAYVTPYLNKRVGNDGVIHVYRAGPQSPTNFMYQDLLGDLDDMVRYRYSTDTKKVIGVNLIDYVQAHPEILDETRYQV